MKFGYFDDANKEYVITSPRTPYPWINYLGTQDFFSLISNTAGGYSFYKDARLRRITRYRYNNVPIDMGGRYFYINDNGTIWNPGWSPVKTELDEYQCLSFDQGKNNSLYLAEEMKSTYEYRRLIKANDRATLLNLMIGLNAYTLCSGIICEDLNGNDYKAVPLKETEKMRIGYIKRKGAKVSHIGELYIEELKKYKEKVM